MSTEIDALVAACKAVLAKKEEYHKLTEECVKLAEQKTTLLADIKRFGEDRIRAHNLAAEEEVKLAAVRHKTDEAQTGYAYLKAQIDRAVKGIDERRAAG